MSKVHFHRAYFVAVCKQSSATIFVFLHCQCVYKCSFRNEHQDVFLLYEKRFSISIQKAKHLVKITANPEKLPELPCYIAGGSKG